MRLKLLPCALLLLACPSEPLPTLGAFCLQYTNAVCARLAECRGGPAEAWCQRVSQERLCQEVAASERAGRTVFHADYAKDCITLVDTTGCKFLGSRSSGELDVLCSEALVGHVEPGGNCFADRECGRDYHCDRSATRCPGVCRRLRESGESCDLLTGVRCNTGLNCIGSVCTVSRKQDEMCSASSDCEAGLACDQFAATSVSCQPERSTGPCRPGEGDCAPRATCTTEVPDAGQCAVAKQEGETCAPGLKQCGEMLTCPSGTCVRWGRLGDACGEPTPGEKADCLEGGCDIPPGLKTGTCIQLDAGAPCELDVQCGLGGQCLGTNPRVCVPRCGAI